MIILHSVASISSNCDDYEFSTQSRFNFYLPNNKRTVIIDTLNIGHYFLPLEIILGCDDKSQINGTNEFDQAMLE